MLCRCLVVLAALAAGAGCKRACEDEPPALQVDLELGSTVPRASIATLEARWSGTITCAKSWTCGGSTSKGLTGTTNPWTIGAASWLSTPGTADKVAGHMKGRIDSFRISNSRRKF